ncbi:YbaK/EbsC family protein [Halobacteriovorax sp. GB3]|uniref:aminoacyl-tRNA deacylase n=1 Tax=Halobacteriovorax sp. GB3 TaxID=2719615 RepID=UPI0023611E1E|nr:YbaK/EbsC family protein [Halobacteriovorax sp. GB3]MDD0851824.1 YbaK/EbsC family protein [Halobacteriovorax sp. GB3]
MSLPIKVQTYLNEHNYHYKHMSHEPTETALETAASVHCPQRRMAKVLACRIDGEKGLLVLPANERFHAESFKDSTGTRHIELMSESEMEMTFDDCEVGAIPPFSELYNATIFLSNHFEKDGDIYFNAGTHRDLVRIPYLELVKNERPMISFFSVPIKEWETYKDDYIHNFS